MTKRFHLLIVGLVLASVFLAVPAALAQDDLPEPELAINLEGAGFGERVIVSGTDWPVNSIVQVQICGNDGLNGSSDCDQFTTFQAGVDATGRFGAVMLVGNPPVPCPCVFRVSSVISTLVKTIEFELRGAAIGDEPASVVLPERQLAVIDARIEGSGPWTALFGARPDRTLIVTIRNTGFVAVDDPNLILAVGKGENPTGFVSSPGLGRIEPGDSVTVTVAVELPVFAMGTYGVVGSIPGFDIPVEFRSETSHVPWLLVLVPLLILAQVTLITVRNRLRSRIEESIPEPVVVVAVEPEPDSVVFAPEDEPVIDLVDEPVDVPQPIEAAAEEEVVEVVKEDVPVVIDLAAEEEVIDLVVVEQEAKEPFVPAVRELLASEAATETAEEVDPEVEELATVIGEELDVVFKDALARRNNDGLSDTDFVALVQSLSAAAGERVASRTLLTRDERVGLDEEIAAEMLTAFGFEREGANGA